jgi:hypothetical protein
MEQPMRSIVLLTLVTLAGVLGGCGSDEKPPYGVERQLMLPGKTRQVWAVAPAINLSGQRSADVILQSDLVYTQLQQVAGLTVIPVNRVVEVYMALHLEQVQTDEQAALVCDILGCDALLIPTITVYDPYEPPKLGASLNLFRKGAYQRQADVDSRELARRMAPAPGDNTPKSARLVQAVGMYDAANGSTRAEVLLYAQGRTDPSGPYKERAYLIEMDRYCGFVYHSLIEEVLGKL